MFCFLFLFFPPDVCFFMYFVDAWVLRDPTIAAKKQTHSSTARQWHMRHVCKLSGSSLSKTAWAFGLLCGRVLKSSLRIVITCFLCIFDFGR